MSGLTLGTGCLGYEDLARQSQRTLNDTLDYGTPFTPGKTQARLFGWTRSLYWNADQTGVLPPGGIAAEGLLHHETSAVLTPDLVDSAFDDQVSAADMAALAGYKLAQGYWWNRGLIQHYATDPRQFYLPIRTDGAFDGVDPDDPFNPVSTVAYDTAALLPVRAQRYLIGQPNPDGTAPAGAVTLETSARNDWQTFQPWRITDANRNVTEVAFSPLGVVAVSTEYGTENGAPAGDLPLSDYTPVPDPTFRKVIDNAPAYLQGASSFYFYDLFAWEARGEPTATIRLERQDFVKARSGSGPGPISIAVTYTDGLGRTVETKIAADPGEALLIEAGRPALTKSGVLRTVTAARRWAVSGRTVYNNKGEPTEVWLPYFSSTADYEDQAAITASGHLPPPTRTHYDAMDRPVRADTPKGFFIRTDFAAWQVATYDENDTILDSAYFRDFPKDPKTPEQKDERIALDQAVACYNTPNIAALGPAGTPVASLGNVLGAVTPATLKPAARGSPMTARQIWDRLVAEGDLIPTARDPGAAWVAPAVQPYLPRFRSGFIAAWAALGDPILAILKDSGLMTRHVLDIEQREIRTVDPRLGYGNIVAGTEHANFDFRFDMAGNALVSVSADAGTQRVLSDIFGNTVATRDARGFHVETRHDRLQRPLEVHVERLGHAGRRLAEKLVYGEDLVDAADHNLMSEIHRHYDDAGLVTTFAYSLLGDVMTSDRQLRADHDAPADWTPAARRAVRKRPGLTTQVRHNAQQSVTSETAPDGTVTTTGYTLRGLVDTVSVATDGGAAQPLVTRAAYAADGQRTAIGYANGVATAYDHEPTTRRLLTQVSRRGTANPETLQDLRYTYDPVGNIAIKTDRSWETVFCYNQMVSPRNAYRYDPLYRLIHAAGRQRPGAGGGSGARTPMPFCPENPADGQKLETYAESFRYDAAGNLTWMRHSAATGWTRELPVDAVSNRLSGRAYDRGGNMRAMDHLAALDWSYRGALARADIVAREAAANDDEVYLYDSEGARVLKVTRRFKDAGSDAAPRVEIVETTYVGAYEQARVLAGNAGGQTLLSERRTVSAGDGTDRICLIETTTTPARTRNPAGGDATRWRYLLSDQQDSVALELDRSGQRLTYVEYFLYGGTAFEAADAALDGARPEYRYMGKERDSATGLYCYGMRYYPPWLMRWISPDPAGTVDGANLFAFVGGNPVSYTDPDGQVKVTKTVTVWINGRLVTKPETHRRLHPQFDKIGARIAAGIKASTTDHTASLQKMDKDLAQIQKDEGVEGHDEAKVDKAFNAAYHGDKEMFSYYYRAASKGMDEQLSTASTYFLIYGAAKVGLNSTQQRQLKLALRIASRLRLATEMTGANTSLGVLQHPTSAGGGIFGSSGKNHSYWDRDRRQFVLDTGNTSGFNGINLLLDMISAAGAYTVNSISPGTASNVSSRLSINMKYKTRHARARYGSKRIVHRMDGRDVSKMTRQGRTAKFTYRHKRSMSPPRF